MPKVSVIMGVYNTPDRKMLDKAINSILDQTLHNLEFIICDDGSTDETYTILKEYEKLDDRVIVLRNKENMGLAASLNKGISIANSDYIARQDADDISTLDRLEKEYNFLENNKEYGFVGSNISLFDESGIYGEFLYPEYPKKESFLFVSPFNHGSVMMRKEMLDKAGGYSVGKLTRRCEDYELFMRLYTLGYKAYNFQEKLYAFREDDAAVKRRKYKYRIDEVPIRWRGFKALGLMPKGLPYVLKPLIVGLIPVSLLNKIKNRYYKDGRMRT